MSQTDERPITPDWFREIGVHGYEGLAPKEYGCRVRGGSDPGCREDSDDDRDGDEVANLVFEFVDGASGPVLAFLETYELPSQNTTECIALGERHTRAEVLDLLRGLKAWAIRYPAEHKEPARA